MNAKKNDPKMTDEEEEHPMGMGLAIVLTVGLVAGLIISCLGVVWVSYLIDNGLLW